jgi:large subunit ribosomal protein L3
MAHTLMGKKRGMAQFFDKEGHIVPCTVIEVEPNVVSQIKTKEKDGYNALQLSFEKVKGSSLLTIEKRIGKPLLGHFKKAGVEARRYLAESQVDDIDSYKIGQEIGVGIFNETPYVDVIAYSKGKGFQGVIKRHHYAGGPASHGSGFHRHAGSTGQRTSPGRTFQGVRMAGHMGHERVTVQNLKVIMIDEQEGVIVVKGQVPGPRNALVYITQAKKKQGKKKSH